MEMKLEVVPLQVSDIDRVKRFYAEQIGFAVDLDMDVGPGGRRVQLTPPGSGCSIHLTASATPPCTLEGLILVVEDIEAVHAELAGRGVEMSAVRHMEEGEWVEGKGGRWNSFVHFSDPDGNLWMLQERPVEG
jgi:predicted enzyme related to lactoylglutathione lyase